MQKGLGCVWKLDYNLLEIATQLAQQQGHKFFFEMAAVEEASSVDPGEFFSDTLKITKTIQFPKKGVCCTPNLNVSIRVWQLQHRLHQKAPLLCPPSPYFADRSQKSRSVLNVSLLGIQVPLQLPGSLLKRLPPTLALS